MRSTSRAWYGRRLTGSEVSAIAQRFHAFDSTTVNAKGHRNAAVSEKTHGNFRCGTASRGQGASFCDPRLHRGLATGALTSASIRWRIHVLPHDAHPRVPDDETAHWHPDDETGVCGHRAAICELYPGHDFLLSSKWNTRSTIRKLTMSLPVSSTSAM